MIRALREAASAAGPLRTTILLAVLVHATGTFAYLTLWRTVTAPGFDVNDFKAYYTGALALSEGRADLLYPDPGALNLGVLPDQEWVRFAVERGVPHPSGYIYPPFLAVALRPITMLSYHRANQAWFCLNVVLFAASVCLLVARRASPPDLTTAAGILFTCLCFHPTYRAFQCGQVSLLMLFLTAASLWCLERGKEASAGLLVAAAAAVKLTPAVLVLYFLAARRYRAALWSVLGGAATLALSVAGAGWENHVVFLRDMLPALSRGAATFANQSLAGTLDRLVLDVTMNAFEFVDEPTWLRILSRGGAAAILAASLWIGRRRARDPEGVGAGFALVVLASLLASPISWEHHFVLALIPIAVLLGEMTGDEKVRLAPALLFAAAYALTASNAYDLIRHHFPYALGRVAISYAFFGACALWALIAGGAMAARSAGTAGRDRRESRFAPVPRVVP